MIRITTALLSIVLLAGCVSEGEFIASNLPNSCTGGTGYTFVFINYGDGYLTAKSVIEVEPGNELQYRLRPGSKSDLVTFRDSEVTITAKTAPNPPFPAPPSDSVWLHKSGTYRGTGGVMTVCVPPNPVGHKYYYTINVQNVGQLDPRADIRE
jgi:hypothetical protein